MALQVSLGISSLIQFVWLMPPRSGSSEERRLRAILLVDTLNFCFWPCVDWEYDRFASHARSALPLQLSLACRLASAIRSAALKFDNSGLGPDPLDPLWSGSPIMFYPTLHDGMCYRWSGLSEGDLVEVLGGQLPDMQERARLVREVGGSISGTWGGSVSDMIAAAGGSACRLVDLVTSSFAGFRDTCIYRFITLSLKPVSVLSISFQGSSNISAETRADICCGCVGHAQV